MILQPHPITAMSRYIEPARAGFMQGLREGPRGFFAPLRPRLWRHVARSAHAGVGEMAKAFCTGVGLIAAGRIDRHGRALPEQ